MLSVKSSNVYARISLRCQNKPFAIRCKNTMDKYYDLTECCYKLKKIQNFNYLNLSSEIWNLFFPSYRICFQIFSV